jgi:hypothetical protein
MKESKHDVLLSTIYERIFLIQCVPGTLWPIQATIGMLEGKLHVG